MLAPRNHIWYSVNMDRKKSFTSLLWVIPLGVFTALILSAVMLHFGHSHQALATALPVLVGIVVAVGTFHMAARRTVSKALMAKAAITQTRLPDSTFKEILASIAHVRAHDDVNVPAGADDHVDNRLVPYYRAIVNHLATAADNLSHPRERAKALEQVVELDNRWAPHTLEFELEMESYLDEGDNFINWLRPLEQNVDVDERSNINEDGNY
jgi:hypothetical protein